MPTLPSNVVDGAGDKPYRVLLTGFGPFGSFAVNPSWLAVKPLHNLILDTQPAPVTHEEQVVLGTDGGNCGIRQLHITSLQVPTEYDVVLSTVPSFHTRPPTLPESDDPGHPMIPADGYDLVFHVGVAGPGPARLEKLGHKSGYQMRDAAGKMAPIIAEEGGEFIYKRMTEAEEIEMARIRERLPNIEKYQQTGKVPLRGFAKGYEQFEEEIHTDIDVERLVAHLKEAYPEYIRDSVDAGRYLCDFTYYCSLAEAQRQKEKDSSGKRTKVLFLHCPPIDQPLGTEEVTDMIKRTIVWVSQNS